MYLRDIWNRFPKELKTVLKSNIFNWFNDEQYKIVSKDYSLEDIDNDEEPWYNHSYVMSDDELSKIFRIEYLSTVIGDATPWGGSEYTPLDDLSFLECFPHLKYLDVSLGDGVNLFNTCPVMHKIEALECSMDNLDSISFIPNKFPHLKYLSCTDNKISTIAPLFLCNLSHLDYSDNPIPEREIAAFKLMFPECTYGKDCKLDIFSKLPFEINQ